MRRASISVCVMSILLATGGCTNKEKEDFQLQSSKEYKTIVIQDSYLIGNDTMAILIRGTAKGLRLALSTAKGKAIFEKLNKAYINDEAIEVSTFIGTDLISDVNYQATANGQKGSSNKPLNKVTRRVGLQDRPAFITYADLLPPINNQVVTMEVARQMCSLAIEDGYDQHAYNWLSDGCWAKAMRTHDVVEKRLGIKLDRVWLYGYNSSASLNYFSGKHSCFTSWYYHTAPIAYVTEPDGSVRQYVIDPAIASDFGNQPLRLDHWESLITESNPNRIQYKFIVNGEIYVPAVGKNVEFFRDEGAVDSRCVVYGIYRENLSACEVDRYECFNRGCAFAPYWGPGPSPCDVR